MLQIWRVSATLRYPLWFAFSCSDWVRIRMSLVSIMKFIMKFFPKDPLGIRALALIQQQILRKLELQEVRIMAVLNDIFAAIQTNAQLSTEIITDAIQNEREEIRLALEAALNNSASPEQLSEALSLLQTSNERLGEAKLAIMGLVPTIPTPGAGTPIEEPAPPSLPLPELPETDLPIDVIPSESGLPGSFKIDLKSK